MEDHRVWNVVLEELKKECADQGAELWFGSVKFVGREHDKILLSVPNQFCREWIEDKFGSQLEQKLRANFGKDVELSILIKEDKEPTEPLVSEAREADSPAPELKAFSPNLNPRYVFETFVVGPCNQFAHAACKAVADSDGVIYNPLFIYGGVGLGKTHLLNAIGNQLLGRNPGLRVISIQAESFMNDLISSIPSNQIGAFRKRFRKNCDVLLMDDIEIICGKQRTQEEFFYTFNELYESGRQIVMTSDRVPAELPELTERLRSRFESGMIVDIQAPEYETKVAIIRKKAAESNLQIPDEVCDYLAKNIRSNIRKLEGSMIRVCAYASLTGEVITIELAKKLLSNILMDVDRGLNPEKIIKAAATTFGLRIQDIKSDRRMRKFVVPRQVSMYLCRKLLSQSFPEIGQAFGNKDHSTVIHSCNKITNLIDSDPDLRRKIELIYNTLGVKEEVD
jgi:chromosomal replication initiator protein